MGPKVSAAKAGERRLKTIATARIWMKKRGLDFMGGIFAGRRTKFKIADLLICAGRPVV
jgi:hypothetical protein